LPYAEAYWYCHCQFSSLVAWCFQIGLSLRFIFLLIFLLSFSLIISIFLFMFHCIISILTLSIDYWLFIDDCFHLFSDYLIISFISLIIIFFTLYFIDFLSFHMLSDYISLLSLFIFIIFHFWLRHLTLLFHYHYYFFLFDYFHFHITPLYFHLFSLHYFDIIHFIDYFIFIDINIDYFYCIFAIISLLLFHVFHYYALFIFDYFFLPPFSSAAMPCATPRFSRHFWGFWLFHFFDFRRTICHYLRHECWYCHITWCHYYRFDMILLLIIIIIIDTISPLCDYFMPIFSLINIFSIYFSFRHFFYIDIYAIDAAADYWLLLIFLMPLLIYSFLYSAILMIRCFISLRRWLLFDFRHYFISFISLFSPYWCCFYAGFAYLITLSFISFRRLSHFLHISSTYFIDAIAIIIIYAFHYIIIYYYIIYFHWLLLFIYLRFQTLFSLFRYITLYCHIIISSFLHYIRAAYYLLFITLLFHYLLSFIAIISFSLRLCLLFVVWYCYYHFRYISNTLFADSQISHLSFLRLGCCFRRFAATLLSILPPRCLYFYCFMLWYFSFRHSCYFFHIYAYSHFSCLMLAYDDYFFDYAWLLFHALIIFISFDYFFIDICCLHFIASLHLFILLPPLRHYYYIMPFRLLIYIFMPYLLPLILLLFISLTLFTLFFAICHFAFSPLLLYFIIYYFAILFSLLLLFSPLIFLLFHLLIIIWLHLRLHIIDIILI